MNERYLKYKATYTKYRMKNKEAMKASSHIRLNMYSFGRSREEILNIGEYKCISCGMSDMDHIAKYGFGLAIHHKDNSGRMKTPNNNISNLELRCYPCHSQIHKYWKSSPKCKKG